MDEGTATLQIGDWPTATLRPLDELQIRQFASRYLLSGSEPFLEQVLPNLDTSPSARTSFEKRTPGLAGNELVGVRPEQPVKGFLHSQDPKPTSLVG